ncbi:hypothetical protein [Micromonospora auratinigra]|uniref:Uncharacterized protein n=1 Tax=Micromonospora auratinigra TaxID=261654 RepID=A0A1A9A2N0_9ACTN|nr:hypothetical protein [Micromonospora auratinigra]SBT50384.1 hypothetical protein GA0070611_4755 [Micromonospora auratinigra]
MSESAGTQRGAEPTSERLNPRSGSQPEPDVLLDIPEVTVDQLRLAVDRLDADLSLRVRLANLLQLDAGVRVHLTGVELDVTGVSAEALLKVRLEKLVEILDRAFTTLDRNPQIIEALARSVGVTAVDVDRVTGRLAEDEAADLVEESARAVDRAGSGLGTVGAVADRVLREQATGPMPPAPPSPAGARPPEPPVGPPPDRPASGGPAAGGAAPPTPDRAAGAAGATDEAPDGAEGSGTADAGSGQGAAEAAGRPGAAEARGGSAAGAGPGGTGKPASGGGRPDGPSGAAQAAGETLRQAGRSVWEAIQNGMGPNRQQRPRR